MPIERLRLNQAISKTGYCSRRQADKLIASKQVRVNGKVVDDFSYLVNPDTDKLAVNGHQLTIKKYTYVALYKPVGIVTSCSDEKGRAGILSLLPTKLRHLRPVGRLDMYSEGLIILTNDGQLTQKITHPVHHLPRKYDVVARGFIADSDIAKMRSGMSLSDGTLMPASVKLFKRNTEQSHFQITLFEGRNRQIRRMCLELGHPVAKLLRISIGELQLGQMTPGSWRFLTPSEIAKLEKKWI